MALAPDKVASDGAVSATKAAAAKRAAAPDWSDLVHAFGEQGLERDANGKIKGYRYPQPKDEEDRKRINAKVYEMWNPQRRLSTDIGAEASAKLPTATLVDRESGQRFTAPTLNAERLARKRGLVEAPNWSACRIADGLAGDMLWKLVGSQWWPTGRRCLGTPLDDGDPSACRLSSHVSPAGDVCCWDDDAQEWTLSEPTRDTGEEH